MPIHPDVPGLEAYIVVDGQHLQEYDERVPAARGSVERYIVAKSSATFEVHFRFSSPFPTELPVSVLITVDGHDMDEPLIRQEELYDEDGHVSAGPVSNAGKRFRKQKYHFSELEISEDVPGGDVEAQKEKLTNTGTISLHFYRIQTIRLNKSFEVAERMVQGPDVVHEKALKGGALSHTVKLTDSERTDSIDFFDAEYANSGEPFAVFHFYYRSLEALKNLHIIKRSPEPVDLIECDDELIQTSSPEELRRMFAHWKRQEEIRYRMKRERERSESVTVVGDDEIAALSSGSTAIRSDNIDEDVIVTGAVDRRKERLKRRKPTQEDEIIPID